jgi:hypothetical protein
LVVAVGVREADKHDGAMADLSYHVAADADFSALGALNERSHRVEL